MAEQNEIRVVISATAASLRAAISGAKGDLGGLSAAIKAVPNQIRISAMADTAGAELKLKALHDAAKDVKTEIAIKTDADTGVATAKLRLLQAEISRTQDQAARASLGDLLTRAATGGGGGGGFLAALGAGAAPLAGGAAAAVTGVGASAGQGLLGAGAIGAAGVGAVGIGGLLPLLTLVKPALGDIQTLSAALTNLAQVQELYGKNHPALVAAQNKYNAAVAAFGPSSTAAVNAHARLVLAQHQAANTAPQVVAAQMQVNKLMLESSPQARQLAAAMSSLNSAWNDAGLKIVPALSGVLTPLMNTFRSMLPTLVEMAKIDLRGLAVAIKPLLDLAKSPEFRALLLQLARNFAQLMPIAFKGLADILEIFMRTAVKAGPAMLQMAGSITGVLNQAVAFTRSPAFGPFIANLIAQFRSWLGLIGAVGKAVFGIFNQGASSGQSLVQTLTQLVRAVTPALTEAFKVLSTVIGGIASAIQAMTAPLPGLAKVIPTLAVGFAVLASWKALQAAVGSVVESLAGTGAAGAAGGAAAGASAEGASAGLGALASRLGVLAAAVVAFEGVTGALKPLSSQSPGLGSLLGKVPSEPWQPPGGNPGFLGGVQQRVTGVVNSATFGLAGDLAGLLGGDNSTTQALQKLQQNLKGIADPTQLSTDKLKALGAEIHAVAQMPDLTAGQRQGLAKLATAFDPVNVAMQRAQEQWGATFANISGITGSVMGQVKTQLKADLQNISTNIGTGTKQGQLALASSFAGAIQSLIDNMNQGVLGTQQGTHDIDVILAQALKALGIAKSPQLAAGFVGKVAAKASTGVAQLFYSGGKVTQPGYFAGEEAPMHPEYILATNPAYRERNLGLWASAGHELGVPGFATGGIAPKGSPSQTATGSGAMGRMVAMANQINAHHYPYLWGGGHNSSFSGPYDCSGAVSAVLHAGGFLPAPEVSGQLMSFGLPGPGRVTLFANPTHVYMSLDGHYFGTSGANPGGGAGWYAGGPRPGFAVRHIDPAGAPGQIGGPGGALPALIRAPRLGLPGLIGQVGQTAVNRVAAAANAKLASVGGAGAGAGSFGGGNLNENLSNQAIGRAMMIAAGWPASQWPALQALWAQESGWDANAVNSSSGAYGIPQSLGHGHPFNLGDVRAQIAWGLSYIRGRYGSPDAAEAHEKGFGWYRRGGVHRGIRGFATGGVFGARRAAPRAPTVSRAGSRPPKAPAVKHPKTFRVHVPAPISDALKRLLPPDVVGLDNTAARYAARQVTLSDAYNQLTGFTQLQPPYPAQPLVTLTDADVAALDPQGTLGYQQGDQIVNQSGMTVGRFFGPNGIAGGTWVPGIDQREAQIGVDLTNLYGQQSAILSAGQFYGKAAYRDEEARKKRDERRKRVIAFLRKQVVKAKAIQAELQAITTGDLRRNLARALSRQAIAGRLGTLRESKQDLTDELAAERRSQAALPALERDPTHTLALQAQIQQVSDSIAVENQLGAQGAASVSVAAARGALLKNSLTNRLKAYAKVDTELGGKPYDVGTGGIVGQLQREIDAIDANRSTELANQTGLAPGLQTVRNAIATFLTEQAQLPGTASVQVRTPGGTAATQSQADAQLLALVQARLQETAQKLALSQSQFGVLQGFAPLLAGRLVGTFQAGVDFVPQTGLALVHKGETIIPDPSGPQGNRAAATVHTGQGDVQIELSFGNNEVPLMKLIRAEMNGKALRVVSDHSGQRARLIAGVRP